MRLLEEVLLLNNLKEINLLIITYYPILVMFLIEAFEIAQILFYLFFKFLKTVYFSKGLTYLKLDANDSLIDKTISNKIIFLLKRMDILSVDTTQTDLQKKMF